MTTAARPRATRIRDSGAGKAAIIAAVITSAAAIHVAQIQKSSDEPEPVGPARVVLERPSITERGLYFTGWAKDRHHADRNVVLVITVDVTPVKTVVASNLREPAVGRHGYEVGVPLDLTTPHRVCVDDERVEAGSDQACFDYRPKT